MSDVCLSSIFCLHLSVLHMCLVCVLSTLRRSSVCDPSVFCLLPLCVRASLICPSSACVTSVYCQYSVYVLSAFSSCSVSIWNNFSLNSMCLFVLCLSLFCSLIVYLKCICVHYLCCLYVSVLYLPSIFCLCSICVPSVFCWYLFVPISHLFAFMLGLCYVCVLSSFRACSVYFLYAIHLFICLNFVCITFIFRLCYACVPPVLSVFDQCFFHVWSVFSLYNFCISVYHFKCVLTVCVYVPPDCCFICVLSVFCLHQSVMCLCHVCVTVVLWPGYVCLLCMAHMYYDLYVSVHLWSFCIMFRL